MQEAAVREADAWAAEAPQFPVPFYLAAWARDAQGHEADAVQWYERALALGLDGEDRRGALLGLGSTYRNGGNLRRSRECLKEGLTLYPDGTEFRAFLALTEYSAGDGKSAVGRLLTLLAETTSDPHLIAYRRALLHYGADPDQT